ncbi:NmrA family NAD(P)-binding protein [Flavobacterium sp. GN10]|uniref:NmrA family NAD(P)-binding protein n=1 Tax=Flavobacterium tagetis TaxID=2801336 RepID=A0ABS1KJ89_9FLAO|nr:NAD(P)H-binding protein [Flavobacterium tagetis]MBL0739524.1 NmrA family NAD(P)-binding protein [Flavobacterium tagetis]
MNKILVTGGNGHLGKYIVNALLEKGFKTAVLTTQTNNSVQNNIEFFTGDLFENHGLKEATAGAEVVIHCASNPRNFQQIDIEGTKNLLQAIDRNSIKHFIYISIVGIDKSDYPYYQGKLEVENIIANSGVPFTILRTTQFHDFVLNMIKALESQSAEFDSITIPSGLRFQSVAVQEVAALLASLVFEFPKGLMRDFGGPEVLHLEEMIQTYFEVIQNNKNLTLNKPEDIRHKLFTTGINLCPENNGGKQTWKEYLVNIHHKTE